MYKPALGISILNGELKASVVKPGGVATFESGTPADDPGSLTAILGEAIHKIQSDGEQVAIVLAHPRLIDQVVEIPPVKGWKLARLLARREQAAKAFVGEAAWSSQPALPTKQHEAALLHLCPKAVVDQLAKGCTDAQRQLVRVLPTTSVLMGHLKTLPLQKDEVALLAAETGTGTTVVVGRKDGRVCLGRVLRKNWNTDPESVGVDLTRSIGFAEQQSSLTVHSVWLFGSGAKEQLPRLETLLKVPVNLSPQPYSPFYWADQAASLADGEDGNFLSLESQQAVSRHRFLAFTVWLLCVLGVVTLATVFVCETHRRNQLKTIDALTARIDDLRIKQTDQQKEFDILAEKQQLARVVIDGKPMPASHWFLAGVSEAVPDTLVLTQLQVARATNHWTVHLAGAGDPANSPGVLRQIVNTFSNSLAAGPFHMKITRAAPDKIPGASPVRKGSRAEAAEKDASTFVIEGVMR